MGNETLVIITGPKHSGKTLTGRALAGALEGVFFDLDEIVEKDTGETPRALFKKGPLVFRQAEARSLAKILSNGFGKRNLIIAAGGGLIDNGEALELLKQRQGAVSAPLLVYLEVKAETAWKRIKAEADKNGGELPPFLQGADPGAIHRELHERRAGAYRTLAALIINGEGKTPEEIAAEIARAISR